MTERACDWCRGPIAAGARADSICCSTRCRQARHRFHRAIGRGVDAGRPLRLAYADPPYPGKAGYYPERQEVDHAELIGRLCSYDAWALSTSAAALRDVLASCPPRVRIAAWHRGERPNPSALGVLNAWEPVIFYGGRPVANGSARRIDSLTYIARPRLTDPARVIGTKPAAFWGWLFQLLGATAADSFDDLYPGSGGGQRAWEVFCEAYRDTSRQPGVTPSPQDASSIDALRVAEDHHDTSPRARVDASAEYSSDGSPGSGHDAPAVDARHVTDLVGAR